MAHRSHSHEIYKICLAGFMILFLSHVLKAKFIRAVFGAGCPVLDWDTEYEIISIFTFYLNVPDFLLFLWRTEHM